MDLSHDTIYYPGMYFFINKPSSGLNQAFDKLRYYRKGTFYTEDKVTYYKNEPLFNISDLRCYIEINCYTNLKVMEHVNFFFNILGINYELYLIQRQPRIRGEANYIIWK